jgi:uncharacterized protein YhaN
VQLLSQLQEIVAKIDSGRVRERELSAEIGKLAPAEQNAREAVEHTKAEAGKIEAELAKVEQRGQILRRLNAAAVKAKSRAGLVIKLAGLAEATKALTKINAEIAQIKLTPALLKSIEDLERQQTTLEAQLAAAASQLALDLESGGTGRVKLGGALITAPYAGAVVDQVTIRIEGIASITVTPPLADVKQAETKRQKLAADLKEALRKAAAESPAKAVAALARRRELEAQRQGIRAELKAFGAGDDDAPLLMNEVNEQIADVDAAVEQALKEAELEAIPDDRAMRASEEKLMEAHGELQRQRAALTGTRNGQDELLANAMKAHSGAVAELAALRRALEANLNSCPDAERAGKLQELSGAADAAQVAHEQAAGALEEQRRQAPEPAELERQENRCRRLREQRDNREIKLRELDTEIARLETHIEVAGGEGVGEDLARTQAERELAEREVARITSRLGALRLLRDTVSSCLTEGQERYFEPVRRHLRPFLHDLFPGAELQLSEGFEIAGMNRGGEEPFARLSDGTKEQIAILVRLAMGAMLAERGQAVPIVLDDALVFSDDERIQRMFDALSRAGQQQQLIVLTCRTKAFEQLGGRSLRIEEAG